MEELTGSATDVVKSPAGRAANAWYLVAKRIADRFVVVLLSLLCLPLMLIVAALIKLDSRGPVLFKQTRIGKGREPFKMYKFRTMCNEAEDMLPSMLHLNEEPTGMLTKIKDDPRITRLGRILRTTSIDELPQLLNVIKGDMSLVGPRPPMPSEVVLYNDHHMRRLEITPGITGLWQVSGRKNLSFEEMVELDLAYTAKRGPLLDLWILLKTFPEVLKMNGAR